MSSFDRDRKRMVSEPTEADFIRGLADSATKSNAKGGANMLIALAAGVLMGKALRR